MTSRTTTTRCIPSCRLWLLIIVICLHGDFFVVSQTSSNTCFQTKDELSEAISQYVEDGSTTSAVAAKYGHPIGSWCVSQITDFAALFASQSTFNEDLDDWDVSAVTTMERCFERATSFYGDIRSWNVSSVTSFRGMFQQAIKFSGDLSNWNLKSARDLSFMFSQATSIQTDLSRWNVGKVTTMESFGSAAGFLNTNIDTWDVSSCQNFDDMFARGAGFDKNLCAWGDKISRQASVSNMFGSSDTTSSACPAPEDPILDDVPPGPFCHSCVDDAASATTGGVEENGNSGAMMHGSSLLSMVLGYFGFATTVLL